MLSATAANVAEKQYCVFLLQQNHLFLDFRWCVHQPSTCQDLWSRTSECWLHANQTNDGRFSVPAKSTMNQSLIMFFKKIKAILCVFVESIEQWSGSQLEGQAGFVWGASVRGGVHRPGAPGEAEGRQRSGHENTGRPRTHAYERGACSHLFPLCLSLVSWCCSEYQQWCQQLDGGPEYEQCPARRYPHKHKRV